MDHYTDDVIREYILVLTAGSRYRDCAGAVRAFIGRHGVDPMQSLWLATDFSDGPKGLVVSPDLDLVDFHVGENRVDRLRKEFGLWTPVDYFESAYAVACSILRSNAVMEFDAAACAYYNREWRDRDARIPNVIRGPSSC